MIKRQAILYHKYYSIDGLDGIGKTTQITLLKNYFENKGKKVATTRAIGGPVNSEIEKLREIIFNNSFTPDVEEDLFELSSRLNLKWIEKTIIEHAQNHPTKKEIIVIQDRGIMSHFTYSAVKGIYRDHTYERYKKVLQKSRYLSGVNVVLVPENIEMIMKRINDRGLFSQFHDKYENIEAQKIVLERINTELARIDTRSLKRYNKYHLIIVEEKDQPIDVHYKILNSLGLVI